MTIRRLKTYTGSQGYVYQYYFVGQRPAASAQATEYIFDITADRKTTYSVRVLLPKEVVSAWNQVHGRALTDAEQYAGVKLRLFRAFDELEEVQANGASLQIDLEFLERSLQGLGVA